MKVRLLCVGELRGPLRSAVKDYEDRLGHYWRLEVTETAAGIGRGKKVDPERVRRAEEERLLAHLSRGAGEVVALTREGKPLASRELAGFMEQLALRAVGEVSFVIGGAFGLGEEILARSTLKLSLSAMTLPHEVARLLVAEQLYRAGTILRNEPYHKGP